MRKFVTGTLCTALLLTSVIPAFAAGYEVIKEPWLEANMGSVEVGGEDYSSERNSYLYPTVFKNGESVIHEKTWIMPGYEETYYCESMYKVDVSGNMITERKYADDFKNVNYEYDGQSVALEGFNGSYISESEGLLFYPNEWTWFDDGDLEYQKSEKYSNWENTKNGFDGYDYSEWADIEGIYVNGNFNEAEYSSKYYNGVTSAFANGKVGIIDESDNIIVPFTYDMILPVADSDGYTWVLKDGKWGIIKVNTKLESTNKFSDVKENDWFFANVRYAVENGLMSGISKTEFAPNDNLTRAMLVTILYRAEGEPEVNKSVPFSDVNADMYYANAVAWAQQNSIVSGINENEFAPNRNITREQIAAIIYRYAAFKGYDLSAKGNIKAYTDGTSISDYAKEALSYAVDAGLITGKTSTTLNTLDNATRAEIAAILQRFIEGNK